MTEVPASQRTPADRWQDPYDLIKDLGIRAPEEIDIEAIAEFAGATVVYDRLDGSAASAVGRRNRAIITVNQSASRGHQRFSAAHELGHWILDRGDAPFAEADPMDEVEWVSALGEEIFITPEQRADEWALALLMPDVMFDVDAGYTVTFDHVRELARRYNTSLEHTAKRFVARTTDNAMLVSSHLDRPSRCLGLNDVALDFWLRQQPGPGTVAYQLLRGSRQEPGSTEVSWDGWIDREQGWWFTLHEDSVAMPGGEVLSLLWLDGDGYDTMVELGGAFTLAKEPGPEALNQLIKVLEKMFGYQRLSESPREMVLVAREPHPHRIVMPPNGSLMEAAGLRRLVDEVARHQDMHRDGILISILGIES